VPDVPLLYFIKLLRYAALTEMLRKLRVNVCLFVFLALQPFWLYFYSPVAGFSLLVFEVS